MTDARSEKKKSRGGGAGKSLKEQYQWQLWFIIAMNSVFLYGVVKSNVISKDGVVSAIKDFKGLVPIGLALVIATVLNGLISPDMKARLVFLRWNHALPGHRAFTMYAGRDPRIDLSALKTKFGDPLPVDPIEQNQVWYGIYRTMENDPAVRQEHRDFLLTRDYTWLSVIFFVLYGITGMYEIPSMKIGLIYLGILALQYIVVRQAASNYGIRMVTTVLARFGPKEGPVR